MTRIHFARIAGFIGLVAVGLTVPQEAWASVIDHVEGAQEHYTDLAMFAGILGGLWALDTVTWPYLTGQS